MYEIRLGNDLKEIAKLRKRYIDRFIDNNNKLYNEQIKQKRKFIDGYCYIGYLWDYLIHKEIVNEEYIESALKNKNQVYVFWDIHSSERIFIKNYCFLCHLVLYKSLILGYNICIGKFKVIT